jgi:hypothetical protein
MLKKVMVGILTTAIVATGASIAAAGSEDDGDDDGHVIHLTSTTANEGLVENPPTGPSGGDRFFFREDLFRDGERVGRDAGECVIVETQGENAVANCVATLELPGGQITVQGLVEFSDPQPPFTIAVTGGTGRYRDADGELTIVEGDDEDRFTIRLE